MDQMVFMVHFWFIQKMPARLRLLMLRCSLPIIIEVKIQFLILRVGHHKGTRGYIFDLGKIMHVMTDHFVRSSVELLYYITRGIDFSSLRLILTCSGHYYWTFFIFCHDKGFTYLVF